MTTPIEKMGELEVTLQSLFEYIQWTGSPEAIELTNAAPTKVAELKQQEKLLSEIF